MKILILDLQKDFLKYILFIENKGLFIKNSIQTYRDVKDGYDDNINEIKKELKVKSILHNIDLTPNCVVIRCLYGGRFFEDTTFLDDIVIKKMEELIPESPLYIPAFINLCRSIENAFNDIDKIIVFETAFFLSMPGRERYYAVNNKIADKLNAIRMGFKGMYHEEASRQAAEILRKKKKETPRKILSLCLDPKPEAAAIVDLKPVMVTGGATLLEGIIGDTCSGDIDTGALITIAEKTGWGYEMLNRLLTEESGFFALAGKKLTMLEIFNNNENKYEQIKDIFLYKLLQITGSAIAVMGGLDIIIFSGKYRNTGEIIISQLLKKMKFYKNKKNLQWFILEKNIYEIIAEKTIWFLKRKNYKIA